jgi:hypothetical protein
MIFKNPEPKNLAEWLETATEGIAPAGKERITREIGAHYTDAVAALRDKGESEEVAQARALEVLGDPTQALKRFRKNFITDLEEKEIARLRMPKYLFVKPRAPIVKAHGGNYPRSGDCLNAFSRIPGGPECG